jgi:hypothetical protein
MDATTSSALDILDLVNHSAEELVEACKAATDCSVVAASYVSLRDAVDAIDEKLKTLHKLKQHMQYTVVPAAFERARLRTLTTSDGYRVTITPALSTKIVDRDLAFEWLRQNGLSEIITETVNASTLRAALRALMEDDGKEPPSNAIELNVGSNTSVTKVK